MTLWVALGVENKGQVGGAEALSKVDAAGLRADGLSWKLLF